MKLYCILCLFLVFSNMVRADAGPRVVTQSFVIPESKDDSCIAKLKAINSSLSHPVWFEGDVGYLLVHISNSRVKLYTPTGVVEIEGTACRAMDNKKNAFDGMIEIAKNAVDSDTVANQTQAPLVVSKKNERIVDMLRTCAALSTRFEDFASATLKEKYKLPLTENKPMRLDTPPPASTR